MKKLAVALLTICCTVPTWAGDVCPANPQTRTEKGSVLSQTDSDNWLGNIRFMCQNDVTMTNDWDFETGTLEIPNSASLPGTCDVGDIYMDTSATSGQRLYLCESTNSWVLQGDGNPGGFSPSTIDTDYGVETVTSAWTITGDWDFGGGGIEIENGTTPPACTAGQLYLDTDATSGQQLLACEAGTFVLQGDGTGSGSSAGSTGDVQYADGASGFAAEAEFNYNSTTNVLTVDEVKINSSGQSCASGSVGLSLASDDTSGFIEGIFYTGVCAGDLYVGNLGATEWVLASGVTLEWSNNSDLASGFGGDIGLERIGIGRLLVNDGTAGDPGALRTNRDVLASTAVAASPNVVDDHESWMVWTNEGATAENHHDLPTAVKGYTYSFCVQDADGIQINAATGDTIRVGATASASGGFISSTTIGDCLTLVAINATEWFAVSFSTNNWTFDT